MTVYWSVIGKDGSISELYKTEEEAKKNYHRYCSGKGYPFHIGKVEVTELNGVGEK